MSYRVVQWGTGNVGRHALRAIIERPNLDLVGVRVYDQDKVGRDAGDLAGGDPVGITAVDSDEAILALQPDCVVHTGIDYVRDPSSDKGVVAEICTLLANGINVVATTPGYSMYLKAAPPIARERIEAACAAGGTTFFNGGTSPGFTTDLWPITMARVARRIDRLWVMETLSMKSYSSLETMNRMGFGLTLEESPEAHESYGPDELTFGRATSLVLLADAFGVELEQVTYDREVAVSDKPVDVAVGRIEPGRVVAQRISYAGIVGGRELFVTEFVWRIDDEVRPDWPSGDRWLMRFDGDPTMESEVTSSTVFDQRRTASLHAAMCVVNAIPTVCDAPPGARSILELPAWAGAYVPH